MADPAYVALALVPGVGRVRLEALLRALGTADRVLAASVDRLAAVPSINRAVATAIAAARVRDGERAIASTVERGGMILAPADDEFPPSLRDIPDAPVLLFALGAIELLSSPMVAVVGSRDHSRYGASVATDLSSELAQAGLTVVSGMARGLDAIAHAAALDAGGTTVGVLGNGLGVVYPAANRSLYERVAAAGCLVTEYPPGERPSAGSFPRRNRLISGLARATVVVEARDGSGALITADCALLQGREVMAVPGPVTSPVSRGTNRLIQLGAKPVLEASDVLEEFGVVPEIDAVSIPSGLSELERRTLDTLATGERHVDDVAMGIDGGVVEALAALTSLEVRGLVVQGPGKVFRRAVGMRGKTAAGPAGG